MMDYRSFGNSVTKIRSKSAPNNAIINGITPRMLALIDQVMLTDTETMFHTTIKALMLESLLVLTHGRANRRM
jgi:hypothetical protein